MTISQATTISEPTCKEPFRRPAFFRRGGDSCRHFPALRLKSPEKANQDLITARKSGIAPARFSG
jgi:hypothetical protein